MENKFTKRFDCVNCGEEIPWSRKFKLYCSPFCREQSSVIRWIRSTISRGVFDEPDVAEARLIRVSWLNSGGYSRTNRMVTSDVKRQIAKKFDNKCALCDSKNTGSHEIDHIFGDSNTLDNLQLLCKPCHRKKTLENIGKFANINPDSLPDAVRDIEIHASELRARCFSIQPLNDCDNHHTWDEKRKGIQENRKYDYYVHLIKNFLKPLLEDRMYPKHIAEWMNKQSVPTFSGKGSWSNKSVKKMLQELDIERTYNSSTQTMNYEIPEL